MRIEITKASERKPCILTCRRDDNSVTYQPSSEFFAFHDLLHYAVETTLGYREAFWGLVAGGRDLNEFGTRNGVKDTYTTEEIWAEYLVSLLQWGPIGGPPLEHREFAALLAKSCEDNALPFALVTGDQLAQIRAESQRLHKIWNHLPGGETLKLTF